MRPTGSGRLGLLPALIVALWSPGAAAQSPGDTVLATPRARYDAPALQRMILGQGYRDVWGLPVPARVLDLRSFAGGLTPIRRGGGQQTQSLRFQGADGRVYTFRSIDKDVSRGIDPQLRGTLAQRVLQDQVSSLLPLSAMVVSPLLDSAGVFNPGPVLRVMPDDPALGEYRESFRGLLGWIEVRPDEGEDPADSFEGALRVISSPRLLERLEEGSDTRVDARAFLRARLMDFLVGDWDRHPDQWRWAGFEGRVGDRETVLFEPVPRDRDWALSRIDGLLGLVAPLPWPQYVGFGPELPSAFHISWNGRGLDRRFLPELEWADYEEVVDQLQSRLPDEVLEDAVGRLPESYRRVVGAELLRSLQSRRNRLRELAREYYLLQAGWVDLEGTDEDEVVELERLADGRVRARLFDTRDGAPREEPYVERTFLPQETREIRVYLMGGDDVVHVRGDAGPILIRVVGGGGDDRYEVEGSGRNLRVYDHRGDTEVLGQVHLDASDWDTPEDEEAEAHGARPRDWGSRWIPTPNLGFNSDQGLIADVGFTRTAWRFRHWPYHTRLTLRGGWASRTNRPRLTVELDAPLLGLRTRSAVRYRGDRFLNYFGFGNETEGEVPPAGATSFDAVQSEWVLESAVLLEAASGLELALGPRLSVTEPRSNPGTLLDLDVPYGAERFRRLSLGGRAVLDRRDRVAVPRSGFLARLSGAWFPSLLDVDQGYGSVEGSVATYLTAPLPLTPTLAVRVMGRRLFGEYPFMDAAYLGGNDGLRGFRDQRFAGDAAVALNAELRLAVTDFFFLFPGDLGVLALADVGRVFLEDEESNRWHRGFGGGVWSSWLEGYALSATVARSREGTRVYLAAGLPF